MTPTPDDEALEEGFDPSDYLGFKGAFRRLIFGMGKKVPGGYKRYKEFDKGVSDYMHKGSPISKEHDLMASKLDAEVRRRQGLVERILKPSNKSDEGLSN